MVKDSALTVTVIGAGKMGLPLACMFASRGASVIAADANAALVKLVNAGEPPFEEPGLADLLRDVVRSGRLKATTDNREAIAASTVCVVLVPVMLDDNKRADLRVIHAITDDLAAALKQGSMVAFETTLPVGETRRLGARIEKGGLKSGKDFDLVFSPERVKSRFVLRNLQVNPKVVGGGDAKAANRGEEFYRDYLGAPVINVGSLEAAELVKLAGMAYRDVNIALANEIGAYCKAAGVDYFEIVKAANTDGEAALLTPGIGVGGHCTPVYPYFLIRDAESRGVPLSLTKGARELNEAQPARVIAELGRLDGQRALILGLAFRPDVKEPAYSPAYAIRDALEKAGAKVQLHDPLFSEKEIRAHGFEPGELDDQDVVVVNTAHSAYEAISPAELAQARVRTLVDGRNLFDSRAVSGAGIAYFGIARPAPAGKAATAAR